MLDANCETITPDEIAQLLRGAGAPAPEGPTPAHEKLAYILNLMMQYPIPAQLPEPNRKAVQLNSGIAALRRALPDYISFWEIFENAPAFSESAKQKIQNTRKIQELLDLTFPKNLKIWTKKKSCWQQIGPDLFEFHAQTPWHERGLFIFGWYQNHVDNDCGISRDSAATRFIKAALDRSKVGHFITLDAIEKALTRARQAPVRMQEIGRSGTLN
jgi:hypothetical protein